MGKNPRRVATARALRRIHQAAVRCLASVEYSSAPVLPEPLEKRQMLSASPAAARKSLSRLDSNLALAYQQYQQYTAAQTAAKKKHQAVSTTPFTPTDSILQTVGSSVFIEAYANAGDSKPLAAALKKLKGQDVVNNGTEIDSLFPISGLGKLAAVGALRFAEPTAYVVNSGAVTSQGDAQVLGPSARSLYNVSGAGVTVGILSDSFNTDTAISDHYSNDVASGDLPANVEILSDATPGTGTDEGRAMAQVVYDTAPSASFAFATGGASYQTANKSIGALVTAGAKVIVDDLTYENEPFFQDGQLAQTAANAVNSGVTYISAAGNFGENSYANTWTSGSNYSAGAFPNASGATPFYGGTSFSFSGVTGGNDKQSFQLSTGSSVKISFQWDQPYYSVSGGTGCRNQVDIYVLNAAGTIVGGSANVTVGADPIQLFQYTNTGATATYRLMIVSEAGTALPGQIKYIDFAGQATNWSPGNTASTIFGHTNAAGVESVGAANDSSGTPVLESYSSEGGINGSGGTPILFNTSGGRLSPSNVIYRQGPSIVGPDDVYTTFYVSPGSPSSNPPFFTGTSASAAAVAGVVALIEQKNASLAPAAINAILAETTEAVQGQSKITGTSTPIANGLDGSGFVQAIPALTQTVGNITGVVYSDNNANAVQDTGETGVNGVVVYVDEGNVGSYQPGDPYATTATVNGSAGVYVIYNQPSGSSVLRVLAPAGYVAVTSGRSVAIAGANTSSGVNFGVFPDAYSSSANASSFTLQLDTTTPANFDVYVNNQSSPKYTAPLTLVPGLSFSFSGNNSTLTVNFANGDPIPGGGITEDAPLNRQGYSNNDVLIVNGTSAADTADVNTTVTTFDGGAIAVNNITGETINGNSGNDVFSVTTSPPPLYQAPSGALVYQTLTFNGGVGNDSLTVNDILPNGGMGTTFNAGTNPSDQNTLNVNAGQFYFAGNPASQSANLTVNLGNAQVQLYGNTTGNLNTSYGSVFFAAPAVNSGIGQRTLAALNMGPQNEVILAAPVDHKDRAVLVTGSLNMSTGGVDSAGNMAGGSIIDLNANDMIITSGSIAGVNPFLASGDNGGTWNGSGIQSSAAATDTTFLTALGSLQNNGLYSSFDGVTNIASAVLIKYTYYGDADLNGKVDGSDYSRIDNGVLTSGTGWSNGDFNYDGSLNGSDYTLLDNAYNTQGPSLS
jgi:hypothetical protein